MLHLGAGAFHRAHLAAFNDDAIEAAGGDWGIIGVSLRHAAVADNLNPQDGLYTLELRGAEPVYRVIGSLRKVLVAPAQPEALFAAFSSPDIHVLTLTVTEPAYALDGAGALDLTHPDVAADLAGEGAPRSVVGWLTEGLARRRASGGGPLTAICCDNLRDNGRKLEKAVRVFAARRDESLARWIDTNVAFPNTMVDAITPASDEALLQRVAARTGLEDAAAVQREPFAQWVVEDRFAGARPPWERAGVEIVSDIAGYEALKLHVLNAAHSALAYLGAPRGHVFVRQASGDPELATFLDAMIAQEVAPALADLDVAGYWRTVRARFAEPCVDHRLDQIARDGAAKLRERIHPLILANARAGRPTGRLARVVAAWLRAQNLTAEQALDDPQLFADPFRTEAVARATLLEAAA